MSLLAGKPARAVAPVLAQVLGVTALQLQYYVRAVAAAVPDQSPAVRGRFAPHAATRSCRLEPWRDTSG